MQDWPKANPNPNTRSNPGPATTIYCIGQQSRSLHKACMHVGSPVQPLVPPGIIIRQRDANTAARQLILCWARLSAVGRPLILILGKQTPNLYPSRLVPVHPVGLLKTAPWGKSHGNSRASATGIFITDFSRRTSATVHVIIVTMANGRGSPNRNRSGRDFISGCFRNECSPVPRLSVGPRMPLCMRSSRQEY